VGKSLEPRNNPLAYATNKPFEDVIWRVFINHYLADDENVVNTDQIPPPPSVKSVALEVLSLITPKMGLAKSGGLSAPCSSWLRACGT
jgi:hypothetical protein